MKKAQVLLIYCLCTVFFSMLCFAEEKIELEKTVIKDNKELPKILFVVPWQSKKKAGAGKQKLELHSLFGNLFMPVMPEPE